MKNALVLAVLLLLVGCSSPIGRMERIWPDGASVKILKFNLTVSMTGAGSVTADEVSWTGTNGFPVPDGTNALKNAVAK